jgi:hypothetical protein
MFLALGFFPVTPDPSQKALASFSLCDQAFCRNIDLASADSEKQ